MARLARNTDFALPTSQQPFSLPFTAGVGQVGRHLLRMRDGSTDAAAGTSIERPYGGVCVDG